MSLDFTAIDFETANRQRASVCAVGMTRVRGGRVVESVSWLIRPPTGADSFDAMNVGVHGIRPDDVSGADDWATSLERITEFVGEDRMVAYNAPFDKAVFRHASANVGAEVNGDEWSCALALAKRHLELEEFKLPVVAVELGVEGFRHHDAESDSLACAQVVLALAARTGLKTVDELWPAPVRGNGGQSYYSAGRSIKKEDLPAPHLDADPSHPLFGQLIVVTGEFEKLGRMEAFELAASYGAEVGISTTLKTSILVVCGDDPHAPGFDLSQGSGKQKTAHKYITERGKNIQIISEQDFYELTGIATPAPSAKFRPALEPTVVSVPEAIAPALVPAPAPAPAPSAAPSPIATPPALAQPQRVDAVTRDPREAVGKKLASRGTLRFTAILLLALGGFALLLTVTSISMGQGIGMAIFFIVITALLGGSGFSMLRKSRKR